MTIQEMHIALKLELDKSDSLNNISFEPEEIDYWLNRAIRLFVKTRYSGSNYKRESFEQTQKRIDDLRSLVTLSTIDTVESFAISNSYNAQLPLDYLFTVGEQAEIVYNPFPANFLHRVESGNLQIGSYYMVVDGNIEHNGIPYLEGSLFISENNAYNVYPLTQDAYVIEMERSLEGVVQITTDTHQSYLDNPFSDHRLYYNSAKPLRLVRDNQVVLISDGQYRIPLYILTYIRQPETVDIISDISCDLPDHTHDEIVAMACDLMIENIESPRIQSRPAVAITE